jgi:hypothetical protein
MALVFYQCAFGTAMAKELLNWRDVMHGGSDGA